MWLRNYGRASESSILLLVHRFLFVLLFVSFLAILFSFLYNGFWYADIYIWTKQMRFLPRTLWFKPSGSFTSHSKGFSSRCSTFPVIWVPEHFFMFSSTQARSCGTCGFNLHFTQCLIFDRSSTPCRTRKSLHFFSWTSWAKSNPSGPSNHRSVLQRVLSFARTISSPRTSTRKSSRE